MIGTSDQSCWLAEACKILLLLLHQLVSAPSLEANDAVVHVECQWCSCS